MARTSVTKSFQMVKVGMMPGLISMGGAFLIVGVVMVFLVDGQERTPELLWQGVA